MLMFNFLDEKIQLDSLPIYVCENPDRMPTTRWMDGDLQLLIAKIAKLEHDNMELHMRVQFLLDKLSTNHQEVLSGLHALQGFSREFS